ncbi:Phosphonate ABC transporter phosphate-binding periplasmic component (TC 3.A.1.9.1) [Enterobacter hormaechei]|nr:Phosphonate ABC transporter phosphate-binding periplasmic component (TC 3.A.1.9.1) [Enterobacter hormaechei]
MSYKTVAALAFTSMFSISTLLSPAHAEEQEKALNFGIISTESQQNLKPQWEPFLKDMETKLGIKVNAFFAPDYAGIIQGMRFNKVDIAWYGNLSAMEAVDRANGQVFAQTVAADGSPGYWSVLIVNKDSPINNLNDMLAKRKELTFGNGDPNSTSGFLVPSYYVFAKNNVSASDFKRTVNASHETNALAVANKQVDVATNNTENLDKLKTSAPDKLKEIKVIWKSPLIPGDPIVWRKNLSENTKDKVYDFFMNYGKNAGRESGSGTSGLGTVPRVQRFATGADSPAGAVQADAGREGQQRPEGRREDQQSVGNSGAAGRSRPPDRRARRHDQRE